MLHPTAALTAPPLPPLSTFHTQHDFLPLTILTGMKGADSVWTTGKQPCDVELPSALSLSIATTRCPSTASTASSSPRDCGSAYADLFSPPSTGGPLSPLELPASCEAEPGKRVSSAACRSLHFHHSWLTQAAKESGEAAPPSSAVLPAASNKRLNRRDKAKRRSRSAQRHPHSQQQPPPHISDSHSPTTPLTSHTAHSTAQPVAVDRWQQLLAGHVSGSDDEWDSGSMADGGLGERVDISRAFVFSDLY